ncbi:MAG TPA: MBL fold metallo-hydrolase [Actinomycetota bacterium]|nr:MBL fold metallo-hydrolase [Actinomycetota bacterium]
MTIDHKRREPAPGVFRLVLPLPFPGLDRVNAYMLAGGADTTLVDCGIFTPDEAGDHGWDDVVAGLNACGYEPADVVRLIITHPHIDHYGMAARFVEESGCELVMHERASDDIEGYRDPTAARETLREMLADHGVAPEEIGELTRWEDWRGFVSGVIEPTHPVAGGETFEIGPRTWEVVYTPGHSSAHVCLWSSADRILISGDHLLPTITPHIDFRRGVDDDPLGDFLESLATIERLDPKLVLPGHGRPFEDGAERARVVARHHDRRLGAILQVVRNEPHTADEITDEIFGTTLLHFQKRLALGEALAHLAYLVRRGEVERIETEDGKRLYRKASRRHRNDDD